MSLAMFAEIQALRREVAALTERVVALEAQKPAQKTLSIPKDDGRNRVGNAA